jgi:general nucleoside transport system ATP-binding protein
VPSVPSVLELSSVSKQFGNVVAINAASLTVRAGTIHALLGENGAGKTTLMRVAYGMVQPDDGSVRVRGRVCRLSAPNDAIRAGIGMVHQHFTLVPSMTVGENLALGGRGHLGTSAMHRRVDAVAKRTGFTLDAAARVESLPVSAQQRVEIAKAIARDPDLLILDEPTAVLAPREIDDLLLWLQRYASEGRAVVLITHKLREALSIADDVTVMRRGSVVLAQSANGLGESDLATAMLGEANEIRAEVRSSSPSSSPVFTANALTVRDAAGHVRVHDASFVISAGECIAIAAIEGAGQHELLRTLAGRLPADASQLQRPAIVGFIPADRHRDAVLLDRTLTENIALRGAGERRGRIDWQYWRNVTTEMLAAFDVRAPNPETTMRALSGGNQQKLVLAREVVDLSAAGAPAAVIADNPTRGLDVRATAAVHDRLRGAAAAGMAVVFYSSDLDELIALATRVFVLHAGVLREVPLNREIIGRAMIGA